MIQSEMAVGQVFKCALCEMEAGRVTVYAPGEPALRPAGDHIDQLMGDLDNAPADQTRLVMMSGVGDVTFAEFEVDAVLKALSAPDSDPLALFRIDPEIVPFWCHACRSSYCGQHWKTWDLYDDGFFDEKRGRCPKGHERKLID
jgi:hypothetical protein